MTANDIVIQIYNQESIRADLGEKMIKEYAKNVAEEAYRKGFNDSQKNQVARPSVALAGLDYDKLNEDI